MKKPLAPEIRSQLEYLRDLGFRELVRPARGAAVVEAAGRAARPEPSRSAPARSDRARSDGARSGASEKTHETLDELAARASTCTSCKLHQTRQKVVFGSGDAAARLMFIGEAPGAQEDRQGLPFVGPAGALLTKIIEAIGLSREAVYIANVVKCRPPGNRDPEPEEVSACRGYLEGQIDRITPDVIVALGRVAAQTLLGTGDSLGRLRNRWHEVHGVPTRVTYHPAALLRNSQYKRPTWDDMQLVRDRLAERGNGSPSG